MNKGMILNIYSNRLEKYFSSHYHTPCEYKLLLSHLILKTICQFHGFSINKKVNSPLKINTLDIYMRATPSKIIPHSKKHHAETDIDQQRKKADPRTLYHLNNAISTFTQYA